MPTALFKYNPGVLGDRELVQSFVVRHKSLDLILETLKENSAPASSNRHVLVVGPRGIGKTMLVRRVAAEVRSNPDYGNVWFPVVFGEEAYLVGSSGEFWLEALFHLSDHAGGRKLERTLDELREEHYDARLRERALAQLLDFADSQRKRLLLVVENLNMLSEQITPEAAWELRHTLANESRIMLLGTATGRFEAITHAGQAWFELFAVHELKPLDREESRTLWHSVADEDLKPGQVRAIRILTGGNPRLLTVLAGFAATPSFRELMEQLVHLIDDHTEYFKGHLDLLPVKERKVFVALLEYWDPVAAADLARLTRMGVNEASALLSRLVARGAVELFERRPRRKLYQAAERLYNIYYLMRRRGQPADRVRGAVSFMVMFYGLRQLGTTIGDLAREACGLPPGKAEDHFVAYAELTRRVPREVWARALDQTPPEFFDRKDAPEPIRQLPQAAKLTATLGQAGDFVKAQAWSDAERALRQAIELGATQSWVWYGLGFVLEELDRPEEAEQAYRKSMELDPTNELACRDLGRVLAGLGRLEEAEKTFRNATDLKPEDPRAWHYLGRVLTERNQHEEAKQAYRSAVQLNPGEAGCWDDLAHLTSQTGSPEEAEQVWGEALRLHPSLTPCAVHLVEARLQRGVERNVILREAEEWIERAGRTVAVLSSMSRFILRSRLTEAVSQAEAWAREATSKDPHGRIAETLALVCAAQGKWAEALGASRPLPDDAAELKAAQESATDFLIQAAAAGHARKALELLTISKGAAALEPLLVGLRIYLGEKPQVAKEILEIGQDVAERIREVARAHKYQRDTEVNGQ